MAKIEVYNNLIKEASEKIEDLADFKIEDLNEQINSFRMSNMTTILFYKQKNRERSEYIKRCRKLKNLIIESSRLLINIFYYKNIILTILKGLILLKKVLFI